MPLIKKIKGKEPVLHPSCWFAENATLMVTLNGSTALFGITP